MLVVMQSLLFAQGDKSGIAEIVPDAYPPGRGRNTILRVPCLSVTENDPGRAGRAFDLVVRSVAEPFRQVFQNRDVFAAGGTSAFFPLGGSGALAFWTAETGEVTVSA
jgi:hypothetical protein